MKKLILLLLIVFVIPATAQVEVADVMLPSTEEYDGKKLSLNGAGVREKLWIDLYAAGLYLDQQVRNADDVLNADRPMAIKLHIVSKLISSEKMVEAVTEGFNNSTNGNTAPIQEEISKILGFFKEDIKKNDVFDLAYIPSQGVIAYKNGIKKGTIPGLEFKKALFGIWLSNRPADDDLKDRLLGK